MQSKLIRSRLMASLAVGALLAAAPIGLQLTVKGPSFAASHAFAKDGQDDSGGGHGGGGDDSGDDDHGGSGSGGGSGHGGGGDDSGDDDGGDDDHGGNSRSGGGSGNSRSGSDHGGDDDDSGGDDHGGDGGEPGDDNGGDRPSKVEISGTGIEVVNADGTKDEIENGVFEHKDANGRTIVERPATRADFDRLVNASRRPDTSRARTISVGSVRKVESSANALEVVYSTGWREELENGRYELKDPDNNTVVERVATQKDLARLRALAGR